LLVSSCSLRATRCSWGASAFHDASSSDFDRGASSVEPILEVQCLDDACLGINFGNCNQSIMEKQRQEDEGPEIKNT
jgi:hypothetical protein